MMGVEQDYRELNDIRASIEGLRDFIAHLGAGERARAILQSSGRGEEIIANIRNFINNAKKFLKRYAKSAFTLNPDGTYGIAPKLFGRTGTVGNAEVAVALNQILGVVTKALTEIEVARVPAPAEAMPSGQ